MKYDKICRVCLEDGQLSSIYTTNCSNHAQISCADAINKLSSIRVSEDDGLPRLICKKCIKKLKAALKFTILYEESQSELVKRLKSNQSNELEVEFDANPEEERTNDDFDQSEDKGSSKYDVNPPSTKIEPSSYFCDICQKNFQSEESHKQSHKSERRFQCEICAKVFLRPNTFKMHLLAHRNELPFRCSYEGCDKAFPLNSRLQLHLKVHTNERNFICHYCSHAARDKQQLIVHIRYFHTKEKNFLCGTCGKAFVSPQARYYHAKRHENIRNHHCPHCDKSFVFAFGLREHLVTHTGEKRFKCSICDSRFKRKAHKEKHETRLHGIRRLVKNRHSPVPDAIT